MNKINDCSTIGEKSRLESELGTRYSVLTELSYYDSIRMAIIDPMHNLFLGMCASFIAHDFCIHEMEVFEKSI